MPGEGDEPVREITIHGAGEHDAGEVESGRRSYVTQGSDTPQRVTYTVSYPIDVGDDIVASGTLPTPIVDAIKEMISERRGEEA